MHSRSLVFKSAAGVKTRTETYAGREHIVVPVVALVEGVLHAMNAPNPEFVGASEIHSAGWDGRPIFVGHPLRNGRPVSGNSPDILESKSVGIVFNSADDSGRLTMEAWIDKAKADAVDPDLLVRVAAGDPIEISVGIFCETSDEVGVYNGKNFKGAWSDIVPDHLALLPAGDRGACSRDMGCGVRAAKGGNMAEANSKRGLLTRFMAAFRSAQPASEMSDQDLKRKLNDALREAGVRNLNYVEAFVPVVNPTRVVYSCYNPPTSYEAYPMNGYQMFERAFTLGENGVVSIGDAEVEVEAVIHYEPVLMNEEVDPELRDAAGKRNSANDLKKIQAMHDHATALGAYCKDEPKVASTEPNAEGGAPCSCGGHAPKAATQGETEMTNKEKMAKFLETATEEQIAKAIAANEAPVAPVAAVVTPEVAPKVAAAVEAPKPVTFAEVLATADADTRESINEGLRVGREKKAATIKALKDTGRCDMTDEQLNASSQASLDQLVKLAGSNVRAAIDFAGQGTPRVEASANQGAPEAPDLGAAIRAAQGK